MSEYTLLSDYGRFKAGSLLSDEAGDPIASMISNGVPVVPTVTALKARATQIKDTFGQPSKPEWQASAVFGQGVVVAEEGTVLNHRPVLNFIGAGVTAADDPTNNRINITIAAEAITGWTDGGTLVYPTTATDDVAVGVQAMEGTERLRVRNSVPLVAAFESTDPGGVGCTISTHSRSVTPADADVIFRWEGYGEADAGATTKTEMFRVDVVADDVSDGTEDATGHVYAIAAGALAESFRFDGTGLALPKTGTAAGAATQAASRRIRLTSSMWTGAAEAERDWDIYANPRSVAADESGNVPSSIAFDYEGQRILEIGPDTIAPGAAPGVQFISRVAAGGSVAFDFKARENLNAGDFLFRLAENCGDVIGGAGTVALTVSSGGNVVALGGFAGWGVAAAPAQHAKIADPAGGGTVDAEARTAINAIIDVLEGIGASALA